MKKTLALILAALMLIGTFSVMAVSAATSKITLVDNKFTDGVGYAKTETDYDAEVGSTAVYTCSMQCSKIIEDGQFLIMYTPEVLEVTKVTVPNVPEAVFNPDFDTPEYKDTYLTDRVKINFSRHKGIDFTTEAVLFTITFKVKAEGDGKIELMTNPDDENLPKSDIDEGIVISDLNDLSALKDTTFKHTLEVTSEEPSTASQPASQDPSGSTESTTPSESGTGDTTSPDASQPTSETSATNPSETGDTTAPTDPSDTSDTTSTNPEGTTSATTPSDTTSTDPSSTGSTEPSEPTTETPTTAPATQATEPATTDHSSRIPISYDEGASKHAVRLITLLKDDKDPAGTKFSALQAKAAKVSKSAIKVSWSKVKGAKTYIVMGGKCGKAYKKLATVSKTSFTQKKLKKGTYYKFMVIAVNSGDKVVSVSKVIHAATKGGKVGNPKSIKFTNAKSKLTLKKGKKFTLKTKVVAQSKKLKIKNHRKIAFESSKPSVVKVNSKGKIKGVKKGTAYIFAYAQNGVAKKVKVTVK